MKNYAFFNIDDISAAFSKFRLINFPSNWQATGVSTDSRNIETNNIFVALKGEKFDGHDAVSVALEMGAAAAIVSEKWYEDIFINKNNLSINKNNIALIVVPNTLKALSEIAFYHRIRFNFPVIAVAGSNGKTSTKELIADVLSQRYRVLRTYKNYNNQIGVPLMMLCFNENIDIAVIEIGTNSPGEIATLSEILQPNFGIITNIGKEHLELLIDIDNVELEETFLFGYLLKIGGLCFINNDDERLAKYNNLLRKTFTYGTNTNQHTDFTAKIIINKNLQPSIEFKINECEEHSANSKHNNKIIVNLNATGYAIALNAVAAAAVATAFELSPNEIKSGLETYKQDASQGYARMFLQEINSLQILNDCYNANPSSMLMALRTLSLYNNHNGASKKIAVLGDMFELGKSSAEEHILVLNYAAEISDEVYIIGNNMQLAAEYILSSSPNTNIRIFNNYHDIANRLKLAPERTIALLKASRGMRMEQLMDFL